MSFKKILKREFDVAFAKNAQPLWMRILKYIVLAGLCYFLWGKNLLPIVLPALLITALAIHFWYRYKTKGWTKSFGGWKYHD